MVFSKHKVLISGFLCATLLLGLHTSLRRMIFVGEEQSALDTQDATQQATVGEGQTAAATDSKTADPMESKKASVTGTKMADIADTKEVDLIVSKKAGVTGAKTAGVTKLDDHNRMILNDVDSATGQKCSQKSRVSLYKKVCAKPNSVHDAGNRLFTAFLDPGRKLFGCLIFKAGSTAWIAFLIRNQVPDSTGLHVRDDTFLRSVGLDRIYRVPANSSRGQFRNWSKYLLVRHPLQRLVSSYYQIQGRFYSLGNKTRAFWPKMTFPEFVKGLVSGELTNKNNHWAQYTKSCQICDVDYQFIMKKETSKQDIADFKKLYKFDNPDITGDTLHVTRANFSGTDINYRYDEMLGNLQDKHPELMHGILKLYGFDMELFGYGWDWDRRRSYCMDKTASGCC